ncbi:MAG: hypothetical protein K0R05_818 [Anaerocolumna sp.]|jgi:hypothetical protein|nr:hypothetical protein [Anaerocolumna sp.]
MKKIMLVISFSVLIFLLVSCSHNEAGNATIVPQIYKDYIKKLKPDVKEEICFSAIEDMNLDGINEIIIATGTSGDDPYDNYVSSLSILSDNNGVIEQIGDELSGEGYRVYQVKLIHLQEDPKSYLYCGLTNGAGLIGFTIIGVDDNKTYNLCYSASATGRGEDLLLDSDNDGQFDGITQYREDYDVLYYPLIRTYKYKNNSFILESTTVNLPDYPNDIQDTILQFISLKDINPDKSEEVNKRISELCSDEIAINKDFSIKGIHTALVNSIVYNEDDISFDIKEEANSATADIVYMDENGLVYKYRFELKKTDNMWTIIKVRSL